MLTLPVSPSSGRNDGPVPDDVVIAFARQGDNGSVERLLRLRTNPIAKVIAFGDALTCFSGQLSLTNLRSLSFLRDMIVPNEGLVAGSEIRAAARAELKRRGAWGMRDRLHTITFALLGR